MAAASLGPADSGSTRIETVRLVGAIALPLLILSLACGLWWISDRLVVIGPLDRAAFGWVVVIPVWTAAPVSAGFAWRRLTRSETRIAALGFGLVVSAVSSVLFWQSVAFPECANPMRSAAEWIVPALLLGSTIGGGLAACGLLGTAITRSGHPWRAVAVSAGSEFGLIFVAIFVFVLVSAGAGFGSTAGPCGLPN
jgi:hypothetical protein